MQGKDGTHFGKPQDVAFLPDGRILIADGLDNHRVMILDRAMNYIGEFGGPGKGPASSAACTRSRSDPRGASSRSIVSGNRINVFKTTADPAKVDFVEAFPGFSLPLDLIVNDDSLWVTDLNPLRFTKLDFHGNHLYTWMVPKELPDGYLEVHTFTVDSNGNLYGGDNQYGRTQKFVPKPGADPKLLIRPPWSARTMARTPDGHPDLQGMWTDYDSTPFERLGPGEQFPRDLAVSTADWLVQDGPKSPRRPSMVCGSAERESAAEAGGARGEKGDAGSALGLARTLRPVGAMHYAWRPCVDDAQRVQQRPSDCADVGLRRLSLRDDS